MIIDDLADRRHVCDLLLDQTSGRQDSDYRPLVSTGCELLLGSRFALLRPQFAAARVHALKRRRECSKIRRILVSFGASDPRNISRIVLEGIALSGIAADVDVVLGAASPHGEDLRSLADTMAQVVEFHAQVTDMANLMMRADLAIGAAGTSTWERCCLGLPSLVVIAAGNQNLTAEELARAGAAQLLGRSDALTPAAVARAVDDLARNGGELRGMGERATQLCDGRGTLRAICALLPPAPVRDGKIASLRLASAADTDIMFRWQADDQTRRYARTPRSPTRDEHMAWVQASLGDPNRVLCLVLHDQTPAGVLRLDRIENSNSYEVSVLVDPDKYGLGIATAALSLGRTLFPGARLIAEVLPGNAASHRLFKRAGYRSLDASHYVSEPRPMP
jgi:spore coat polysaccharide biosynthesis predicted glycosyltransferase SpsG/RimJ/RimL family protein N-acetyltransferase